MPRAIFKNHQIEARLFAGRALAAILLAGLALLGLILRLVNLQIVSHEHFRTLSLDNRVKLEPLPPTRGLIYDAHGVLLAENLPAYSLEITPEKAGDVGDTIRRLSALIPISDNDIKRFERLRQQRRRFDGIPIRVQMSEEELARFAVNEHRFPGVDVHATLLRHYPVGKQTAHVLGYVGRINEAELKSIDTSRYSGTSHIGKNGVEKSYEDLLQGQVGLQQVEVNAKGRVLRVLESQAPEPGNDLHLFIDLGLQEEAMRALGDNDGAVVAIDPNTGGVLALVSKPSFDPNAFVVGISPASYRALQSSPDKPLFNRALRGQYPPGSTIKPFIGLDGLESGEITASDSLWCPGYYQLPGQEHKYRDWKRWGHGEVRLNDAIVQSCDVYFYDLARHLGVDELDRFLAQFGFGRPTGIDLPGERSGLLPSRAWKRARYHQPWYPGETLIMGIGQGFFLATPLQLASAVATLAARGRHIRPRVVKAIRGPRTNWKLQPTVPEVVQIPQRSPRNWEQIIESMAQVIESPHGTARRIATKAYRIAGKTGTAQVFTVHQDQSYKAMAVDKSMRDHAVFVAFAPVDKPRIAIAVLVEHGGHGGSVAAPIARRVMDRYLLGSSGAGTADAGADAAGNQEGD
jgi:penicillin-binding protein 2